MIIVNAKKDCCKTSKANIAQNSFADTIATAEDP